MHLPTSITTLAVASSLASAAAIPLSKTNTNTVPAHQDSNLSKNKSTLQIPPEIQDEQKTQKSTPSKRQSDDVTFDPFFDPIPENCEEIEILPTLEFTCDDDDDDDRVAQKRAIEEKEKETEVKAKVEVDATKTKEEKPEESGLDTPDYIEAYKKQHSTFWPACVIL